MPNIKSAKKRVLIAEVRNARNKANKSALKTAIKKFEAAAVEGNRTEAEGAYKVAVKSIDKAAAKGLMHKASFISSVICVARPSRAPLKMPGNAITLLTWFGSPADVKR